MNLKERLEHQFSQFLHLLEVGCQQRVYESRIRLLAGSHAHGPLQHPGTTEARVVRVDAAQAVTVQKIALHQETSQYKLS